MNLSRFTISKTHFNEGMISALISVKRGSSLIGILIKQLYPLGMSVTISKVKIIVRFLRSIYQIQKHQGIKGLVLYLKACSISLQQFCGSYVVKDSTLLGPKISRTKTGLPRIIPHHHRDLIRRGDTDIVRFWLTLFSLFRNLSFPGQLKLSTITDGPTASQNIFNDLQSFVTLFIQRFIWDKDLNTGISSLDETIPVQILTASPTSERIFNWYSSSYQAVYRAVWGISKDVHSIKDSMMFFLNLPQNRHSDLCLKLKRDIRNVPSQKYMLEEWYENNDQPFIQYDKLETLLFGAIKETLLPELNQVENKDPFISPYLMDQYLEFSTRKDRLSIVYGKGSPTHIKKTFLGLGRLSTKAEAAGKIRVFAMVDAVTQWVLYPLHKYLFSVLRVHPMDGTYNQLNPLTYIMDKPKYSYDLSAATDRLPITLQVSILTEMFGLEFAEHWKKLLVNRPYQLNVPMADPIIVKYNTGQPMGALSSWAMLALTHHFIVQCAYWMVLTKEGKGAQNKDSFPLFKDYALLGDDITIGDHKVAKMYLHIMKELGVGINLAKSIVSPSGEGLEFAKRTFYKGVDVSPIPFKESAAAHATSLSAIMFALKYSMTMKSFVRFLGHGYKIKLNSHLNTILGLLFTIPRTPKQLLSLFRVNQSPDTGVLVSSSLITFVIDELHSVLEKSRTSIDKLVHAQPGYESDLYYYDFQDEINIKRDEFIKFQMDVAETSELLRIFNYKDLVGFLEVGCIKDDSTDIAFMDTDEKIIFRGRTLDFFAIINLLYKWETYFSTFTPKTVLNPKMTTADKLSPTFLETRATIAIWSRWMDRMHNLSIIRPNPLHDLSKNINEYILK